MAVAVSAAESYRTMSPQDDDTVSMTSSGLRKPRYPSDLSPKSKERLRLQVNARERQRMHDINGAMDALRQVMPYGQGASVKKLSKMSTLLLARNYIVTLSRTMEELKFCVNKVCLEKNKPLPAAFGSLGCPEALGTSGALGSPGATESVKPVGMPQSTGSPDVLAASHPHIGLPGVTEIPGVQPGFLCRPSLGHVGPTSERAALYRSIPPQRPSGKHLHRQKDVVRRSVRPHDVPRLSEGITGHHPRLPFDSHSVSELFPSLPNTIVPSESDSRLNSHDTTQRHSPANRPSGVTSQVRQAAADSTSVCTSGSGKSCFCVECLTKK